MQTLIHEQDGAVFFSPPVSVSEALYLTDKNLAPHYPLPVTDDFAQYMLGIDEIHWVWHPNCLACLYQWYDSLGVEY